MSGRQQLAEALAAALPGWQILSHTRGLDTVRQPGACVLWTEKRTRAPALGLGWFADEITLWVLTAADKPALIEDDLDDLLMQVMQALEPLDQFHWAEASRDVLADTFDGYQLTITCIWQAQPDEEAP